MPAARHYPFLDWSGPIPFAHRGGASEAPENSLAAFEHAVGLGYRYLETDVHCTADGVLVAFHDDRLDRVTDRTGLIAELPWAEVGQALIDGREPIPRFDDLLATFPDARINVDMKADATVAPLADTLRRTGSVDRVCAGSFSDKRLADIRRLVGPRLCTSLGPRAIAWLRLGSWLRGRPAMGAPCAQVPVSTTVRGRQVPVVDRRFVDAAHHRGMQVHVWTIDDEATMEALLDLGVDGIMTDRPKVLRSVLENRGAWFPSP